MSWLTVNVGTKDITRELKRIADALEAWLRIVHNYNLTVPPVPPDDTSEPASVSYASDEKTALEEIRAELDRIHAPDAEDDVEA